MKKILKSSVLFFAVCFFAGKANAQLASDTPAMSPEQVAKLIKEREGTTPAGAAVSTDTSKIKTKTIVVRKRPALSDQDGVKPVLTPEVTKPASAEPAPVKVSEVKLPEGKLPVAPVQEEKEKTKG